MIGHKPISLMDPAEAAIGSMEVHVNNAGADEMVTLTQIQTFVGVPVTYSTSEQVWPYAKWIGGQTIYWRTWTLSAGLNDYLVTDLNTSQVETVTDFRFLCKVVSTGGWSILTDQLELDGSGNFQVYTSLDTEDIHITIWYTKP